MKGYQNLYDIEYPNQPVEYKKQFLDDYKKMLNDIDNMIKTKKNLSKEYIKDAIMKGHASENFLDTCIALRINQHKNCIRKKGDLQKELNNIPSINLEGDIGHKEHVDFLKDLKNKGTTVKKNALKYPLTTLRSPVKINRKYRSRAKGNKSLKSRKTRDLIIKKKTLKRTPTSIIKHKRYTRKTKR